LEEAVMNKQVLESMKAGAKTFKGIIGEADIDSVDAIQEELQEVLYFLRKLCSPCYCYCYAGIAVRGRVLAGSVAAVGARAGQRNM
jgi:hypothetical protein